MSPSTLPNVASQSTLHENVSWKQPALLLVLSSLTLSLHSVQGHAQSFTEPDEQWVESAELWQAHVDDLNEQLKPPAINHCEGLISHTDALPVPPIGQSPYMNLYLDPAFNTRNRRISDSRDGQVHRPMSNDAQAWNADESLLILQRYDDEATRPKFVLMDGSNYQQLGDLSISVAASDTLYWSHHNPLSVFYVSDEADHAGQLQRFDIATGTQEQIADFAPVCAAHGFTANGGLFSKPSIDDELFGFQCGVDNDSSIVISYQYSTDEFHTLDVGIDTAWTLDQAPQAMPHGNGFWYQGVALDTQLETASTVKTDSIAFAPNGAKISPVQQQTSNWTAMSNIGYGELEHFAKESSAPTYFSEIFLVNANNTDAPEMCRIAHHRTFGTEANNANYNAALGEPIATMSPSGTRVLFNSDWYDSGSVDTYTVELPSFTRLQLEGRWADRLQPNMITRIAQAGARFVYSRALINEGEKPVVTTGTGRINGRQIDVEYVSKVADKQVPGSCTATIENDINDIAFNCNDTHFGDATYNLIRQ